MPKKEITTYVKRLAIPEDKIAEYKEAFDMFDKNKKGTISANDITNYEKFRLPHKKIRGSKNDCRNR